MAKGGKSGDWLVIEELFERGEPAFVDALRRFDDADTLGAFAPRRMADRRPEARALLFDYLDRPLNAYRHEALAKRLFKLAEAAGDDAVMARFLVLFDRSIRRAGRKTFYEYKEFKDADAANAQADAWEVLGYEQVTTSRNWRQEYLVRGRRIEVVVKTPEGTAMPRGATRDAIDPYSWDPRTRRYHTFAIPDWVFKLGLDSRNFQKGEPIPESRRKQLERYRLYSIATRGYLRRRAWRYFRRLGRRHPDRYLPAVTQALRLYRDDDVADGLELIDNWSLVHALFHFSPVLAANERGWQVAPDRSLAELQPAPMFAPLWKGAHRPLVELLIEARCRPVRSWAVRMIRRDLPAAARVFSLEERLDLLGVDDPEVVDLVTELLRDDPGLKEVPLGRWLTLLKTAGPAALEFLCELMGRLIEPDRVSMAEAVALAVARPLPLASLGLTWLRARPPRSEGECRELLGLVEAQCDPLRREVVGWARGVLSASGWFRPDWVLEWLDGRHEDVRAEGWAWFLAEPRVRDDVAAWQRLMETPYDDVRLALVGELEARTRGDGDVAGAKVPRVERGDLDPELLRLLWASVLLNVHRGGRAKPGVIRQVLRRVEARPDDLPGLLPLLAVALRSVRGPEWRAGLTAVVRLAGRDEASAGLVRRAFPELQLA